MVFIVEDSKVEVKERNSTGGIGFQIPNDEQQKLAVEKPLKLMRICSLYQVLPWRGHSI